MLFLPLFFLLLATPVLAQDAGASTPGPVVETSTPAVVRHDGTELTLDAALARARQNNPTLRGQAAQGDAARAQQDQARAALLPTLTGNAAYARTTSNFVPRPGYLGTSSSSSTNVPTTTNPRVVEYDPTLFNTFSFGVTAAVLLYDFNTTIDRFRSAKENARAFEERTRAAGLTVDFSVRDSFLRARAQKALILVAQRTVENNQRHVEQIQAFVDAGTRPEIDLLQVRTDLANAKVALLSAENTYAIAKVTLQRNMGVEDDTNFEIADEQIPPLPDEHKTLNELLQQAMNERPDVAALSRDLRASELNVSAAKGGYGPSLNGTGSLTKQGIKIDELATNWQVGAQATWQFFSGGATQAAVHEARANVNRASASIAELRQTVRQQVAEAQIGLQTALAQVEATDEALANAQGRLALADGRYEAGVGNVIELGDAQIALTQAESQRIQAEYNISLARAQLLSALGRSR